MTSCEPQPARSPRRWFQFSLRTLLAFVTFSAVLCSVGLYAGWRVSAAILGTVGAAGAVGALASGTERGVMLWALGGLHLCSLGCVTATAYCLHHANAAEQDDPPRTRVRCAIDSAEELMQTLRSLVPSVAPPDAASIQNSLCGHYGTGSGGLSGEDLYLFPDGTYLYLTWADIAPLSIVDEGTWDFRDGVVSLHTNGISRDFQPLDNQYLAFTAILRNWHEPNHELTRQAFLLGAQGAKWYLERSAGDRDRELLLFIYSTPRAEMISTADTRGVKERLYANYASDEMRLRRKAARLMAASAIMVVVSIAAVIGLNLGSRRVSTDKI